MPSLFQPSLEFARILDQDDPLRTFRDKFIFPRHNGEPVLYFCGNSLGLQPLSVRQAVNAELDHWGEHAVEGHFRGEKPWMYYHKFLSESTARLVGALPHEVVVMNTLSVNLHLMMVSFYRPSGKRYKIIMEAGAFPSDQYAVESQVRFHGYEPEDAIIEVSPREGEDTLRNEDILDTINRHGSETALVLFSGVQYYTGQYFDLESITRAAHQAGAYAGFDLAHAAGNMMLQLHKWGPDFAVWCSYKYLNSGPGGLQVFSYTSDMPVTRSCLVLPDGGATTKTPDSGWKRGSVPCTEQPGGSSVTRKYCHLQHIWPVCRYSTKQKCTG